MCESTRPQTFQSTLTLLGRSLTHISCCSSPWKQFSKILDGDKDSTWNGKNLRNKKWFSIMYFIQTTHFFSFVTRWITLTFCYTTQFFRENDFIKLTRTLNFLCQDWSYLHTTWILRNFSATILPQNFRQINFAKNWFDEKKLRDNEFLVFPVLWYTFRFTVRKLLRFM